jgi:hypothetical protein
LPRSFADAVDGAFDLPRARFDGSQRIGDGQAEIVMAMDADDGGIAQRFHDAADQFAIFVGRGVADGIGNVDGARSGGDNGFRNLFEIIGIGAGAVFGGEFDVIDVGARQFDGGNAASSTSWRDFFSLYFR